MNALVLCATVLGHPTVDRVDDVFRPATPSFARAEHVRTTAVVRGQAPAGAPAAGGYQYPNPNPFPTFGGPQPLGDPFLGTGAPAVVGAIPGTAFPFGLYQLGQPRYGGNIQAEWGFLPKADVSGQPADFEVTELDIEGGLTIPFQRWGLSVNGQYGQRWYEGPSGGFGLASSVYRFGADFELASVPDGDPWGLVLGFNPSLNTDFETNIRADAYNWDGRGYVTYQWSPYVTLVGGVGFWDRVNDRFIPYAGVVYKPNSRWEIHATVPEAKISYCLGNAYGGCRWIYFRAEYHVEAYQVETSGANRGGFRQTDKMEIEDYRLMLGYAYSNGWVDGFIEGGYVLGREVDYLSDTVSDYSIDDGFIARVGLRF